MAAPNSLPVFTYAADNQWGATALTAASTAKDGTGANALLIYTADATNGSFIKEILFRAAGTNVATVARVFLNNGSTAATPANNILIGEITLSATTLSEVAALTPYSMPINSPIAASHRLYVCIGTAVAAGYYISAWGGKY